MNDRIFHHIGIPTHEPKPNERYSKPHKMYTANAGTAEYRVNWHRFEQDAPLHPLIKTLPHVAFKVPNLEQAIAGKRIILHPYEPFAGFKVAFIEEGGLPVELIETQLSEAYIWDETETHIGSTIYPKD